MIHPQSRREPGESLVRTAGAQEPSRTAGTGEVAVPRQTTGNHPDAYDLYAQIYALRTGISGDTPG